MKSFIFKTQYKIGRKWEKRIIKFLKTLPETIEVTDVSNDPNYQKKDIDIIWKKYDERGKLTRFGIDVKVLNKNYRQQKLFFDIYSDKERKRPGKFMFSEADYWFYVNPRENILYTIPIPETRTWFEGVREKYPKAGSKTVTPWGYKTSESEGWLVPVWDVLRNIPKAKIIKDFYERSLLEKLVDYMNS